MTHRLLSLHPLPSALAGLALIASLLVAHPSVQAQPAPAPAVVTPRFDVLEFEVEGNTVLPATVIEQAILPFMGPRKAFADVEAARAALEKAYQSAGYVTVFVDLPEQEVSSGVLRLRVLEGQISRLKVTEARYHDPALIRLRVAELAPGKVPNFTVAQAQLTDLNRTEDRRVQPILRPGPVPGTVEAELKVTDRLPLTFNVELNNRQVQYTEPLRLNISGRYGNLFQEDHSLSFIGIVTPQDPRQTKVLGMTYMVPLPEGGAWQGTLLVSDSAVQPVGSTNVVGKGVNMQLKRLWTLPARPGLFHSLGFALGYKDTRERIRASVDGSDISNPLRYMPLVIDYNGSLAWGEQVATLGLMATFAQRGVLARSAGCNGVDDQFGCRRVGSDGSFAAFRMNASYTHPVGAGVQARWRAGAQMTNQPLVSAEQFAVGGVDSVRGYHEAELLSEVGAHMGLEISSPNWGGGPTESWRTAFSELQAYGFAEGARISTKFGADPTARQLAGTGLGVRLRLPSKLSLAADIAWPLQSTTAIQKGQPRLHARLSQEF